MRFRLVLLVAVLSALIGIAGADEFKPPPMKDGLWETHSQTQQGNAVFDTSVKMCQSKELTKSKRRLGHQDHLHLSRGYRFSYRDAHERGQIRNGDDHGRQVSGQLPGGYEARRRSNG
jgi:hypothetical protein